MKIFATVFIALLAATPCAAQVATPPAIENASAPRLLAGGIIGGAAGLLVGGAIGVMIGGNTCEDPGNPDSCRAPEGFAIGVSLGMSTGIPLGVHIANRRKGPLLTSLAVSVAMPLAVGAIAEIADEDRVYVALLIAPFAQLITSVVIEKR
jgi:hypothetical protein